MHASLVDAEATLFLRLTELGAGDFAHLNGTLEQHFIAVRTMLKNWNVDETLSRAGLFHAAYGTAGFDSAMTSPHRREDIRRLIGTAAEEIVYTYCACDRSSVWSQIGCQNDITFRDRFTGLTRLLGEHETRQFCESTCANELEIALNDASFMEQHGRYLSSLFRQWRKFLSAAASKAASKTFTLSSKDAALRPA